MSKVADVKLSWQKSVSTDVTSQRIVIVNNGQSTSFEVGPEIESYTLAVQALGVVTFSVVTIDSDKVEVSSAEYTFTLGDLTAPQPATNLAHEVMGVRDVDDTTPPTTPTT